MSCSLFKCGLYLQEAEQKRLEEEMQKRRERIEQWRAERKKNQETVQLTVLPPSKKWSLEDDEDEEEEAAPSGEGAENDEVDPLDAYMTEVNETVKKIKDTEPVGSKNDAVSDVVRRRVLCSVSRIA